MSATHIENPVELVCATAEETRGAGHGFARGLRGGEVLSLEGPLGAGKTTFVQGLAEGLGCGSAGVSSPTFTLVHEYEGGRLPLIHLDLYRLDSAEELAALGFDDLLGGSNVAVIEWGDKFPESLPPHARRLVFHVEGNSRRIRVSP